MPKQIKVTVSFIYDKEKDKDIQYYKDKAFDEIYYGDDVLHTDNFVVREI